MLSGEVFIPETITVHLGTPDSDAANVTIPYISYLKNVASSEIFPTWPENALRANIYAINTFAHFHGMVPLPRLSFRYHQLDAVRSGILLRAGDL